MDLPKHKKKKNSSIFFKWSCSKNKSNDSSILKIGNIFLLALNTSYFII